jgi:cysteine desulfurase
MIYFDHNATTPVDPEVVAAMVPFFTRHYANPSSPHSLARAPALAIDSARAAAARLLGCDSDHLTFTSGGTESAATAIASALAARPGRTGILLSAVEHAAVRGWSERLAGQGYTVQEIPVLPTGALDLDALRILLTDRIALVAVMLANNETGVLYPVAEVARLAHAQGALMLTDAVQAIGKIPVNLTDLAADYSFSSGHKLNAVKGLGVMYARDPRSVVPLLTGGDQEFGRRPGTEPVPLIAGLGEACRLAGDWLAGGGPADQAARRDGFEAWVDAALADVVVLGRDQPRLPNTTLLLVRGVEVEALLARLDLAGIACSSGSACASGAHEPSHVIRALGFGPADGAPLRISAGRATTDADYAALRTALADALVALRR